MLFWCSSMHGWELQKVFRYSQKPLRQVTVPSQDQVGIVYVTKHAQRLHKILTVLNHTSGKVEKLFTKTLSCSMPIKLDTTLCDQHTLVMNACEFHTAYFWKPGRFFVFFSFFFFVNNCQFVGYLGKNYHDIIQSLEAFGYSNMTFYILIFVYMKKNHLMLCKTALTECIQN